MYLSAVYNMNINELCMNTLKLTSKAYEYRISSNSIRGYY